MPAVSCLCADDCAPRARRRRRGSPASNGSCAPGGRHGRPGSRPRSRGCCGCRRRATCRWTDRGRRRRRGCGRPRPGAHDVVLRPVGVLVLVDEHEAEALTRTRRAPAHRCRTRSPVRRSRSSKSSARLARKLGAGSSPATRAAGIASPSSSAAAISWPRFLAAWPTPDRARRRLQQLVDAQLAHRSPARRRAGRRSRR